MSFGERVRDLLYRGPFPHPAPEPIPFTPGTGGVLPAWTTPAILEELPFHFLIPTPHRCQVCGGVASVTSRRPRLCYHQESDKNREYFGAQNVLVRPLTRGMGFWEAAVQAPLAILLPRGYDGFRVRMLPQEAS